MPGQLLWGKVLTNETWFDLLSILTSLAPEGTRVKGYNFGAGPVIGVTYGDDWRNSYCLIEGDVILRYDGWVTTRCRERKGLEALIS